MPDFKHPDVTQSLDDVTVSCWSEFNCFLHLFTKCFSSRVATPLRYPLLCMQGRHDEAEAILQRAQAIQEKALGPEHPDVVKTLSLRGRVLLEQVRAVRVFWGYSWGPLLSVTWLSSWPVDHTPRCLICRT